MTKKHKHDTEHRWSGWPGAYCLDCGTGHAAENALALGWIDFETSSDEPVIVWKSDDHKRYVELCDNYCIYATPREEYEKIQAERYALIIKLGDAEFQSEPEPQPEPEPEPEPERWDGLG